jgi:hypothetical protein
MSIDNNNNQNLVSPNGTIRVRLGDKSGNFAVNYRKDGNPDNPQIKREFSGVYINLPVTQEALDRCFSEYKTEYEVYDASGQKIGVYQATGSLAAGAEKFKHSAESVRGEIRTGLEAGLAMSDQTVRDSFDNYTGPSGRKGGFTKQVTVDLADIARLAQDPVALAAYLAERGAKVA